MCRGLDLQENEKGGDSSSVADEVQEGGITKNDGEPIGVDELYDLEHYDSDGEADGGSVFPDCILSSLLIKLLPPAIGERVSGAGMGNGLAGLTYYASNEDDPYITLKNVVRAHNPRSRVGITCPPLCLSLPFSP